MTERSPFDIEAFASLGVEIFIIAFRIFCRARQVGLGKLELDDYLMILVILPLTAETVLASMTGKLYHGLTNSGMTEEERASLDPTSGEYKTRVDGSKTQIVGWCIYVTVMWLIKASMCSFYARLTSGLQSYRGKVYIGIGFVAATYVATICCLLFSCYPLEKNWQIYPDPGNVCQPAISRTNVYVTLSMNMSSDVCLLIMPLPMLIGARIGKLRKAGLIVLFSGGFLVIITGVFRCIMILSNPITGPSQAANWAIRESFIAVLTSNIPLTWGWLRQKLRPVFGSLVSSNRALYKSGAESNTLRLDNRNTPRTTRVGPTSTVCSQSINPHHDIFIHADGSCERIIASSNHYNGTMKDMEAGDSPFPVSEADSSKEFDYKT